MNDRFLSCMIPYELIFAIFSFNRLTRSSKSNGEQPTEDEKRTQGLTKSVVKRKRTVEAEEPEMDFSFTPTHPNMKKSRTSANENEEPPTIRSTRATSSRRQTDAPKAATSSRQAASKPPVGVRTSVPSKASKDTVDTPTQDVNNESTSSIASNRPRRSSTQPKTPETTPSKKRKAADDPNSEETIASEIPSAKKPKLSSSAQKLKAAASPGTHKAAKSSSSASSSTPSAQKSQPTKQTGETPKTSKRSAALTPSRPSSDETTPTSTSTSIQATQSPKATPTRGKRITAVQKESPPPSSHASPSRSPPPKMIEPSPPKAKPNSPPAKKSAAAKAKKESPTATLEENPISYWDFVNVKRGDKLIRRLVSSQSDGSRRVGFEEEASLRIVQSRFFAEAEILHCPDDVLEPNPSNAGLLTGESYYQRIIELLEKENEELEAVQRRVQSQLESIESAANMEGVTSSKSSSEQTEPKTPSKRGSVKKTGGTASKSKTATPSRSKAPGTPSSSKLDQTESAMNDILMNMPPNETLLSEEEKLFLADRPALASNLQLSSFARLQTKIDSLELMIKQIGYINGTFEEKTIGISSAMRNFMVPAASAKVNLSRIPASSPVVHK
jgi:hypothetical protein